jgi:hypothetical protein
MKKLLFIFLVLFLGFSNAQTTVTFDSSGTFEVPPGVTEITVEVWGAGGGGATNNQAAGGGGGGGYARSIIVVTPGDSFNYIIGQGGTPGNNGEDSSFDVFDVTIIGGGGLTGSSSTGGNGGIGTGGNETNLNGGNGGDAQGSNNPNQRGGGGGGGSATSTSNGNNGQNGDLTSGGDGGLGEGDGGQGGRGAVNGVDGNSPGGGGGGKGRNGTSGNGADGRVRITYTASGCPTLTSVSSNVTDVQTNYIQTPEQLNLYTDGSDVYSFGLGIENDLLLEAFGDENNLNFAIERLADRILLRRAGNSGQGVNGEERHILFFEKEDSYDGTSKNFKSDYFATMDEALVGTGINRGGDNIFVNSGGTNVNNIQRLDYIFDDGIEVPEDPSTAGFPIFERGGNDPFNFAVISELDANNEPSKYETIISYKTDDWKPTGVEIEAAVLSGFPLEGENLLESANLNNTQPISVIFVSFEDMGFSAGDIVYGYSLAGADSTTDCNGFLEFSNTSFFPQDTNSNNGGIDLMSGGSSSKVAFIHTDSGWYQGDNPNLTTPSCDDSIIVSGGEAILNSDMTFSSISALSGSINLDSNILSLCSDINVSSDFEIKSGTLQMIGPGKQFIRGSAKLIVDDLLLNNTDDLEIRANLDIKGVLDIINGDFITNATTTLFCDFGSPTGGPSFTRYKVGQIGQISSTSNIVGDVTVEQCFPGRRAFRLVSASTTTTTSIHDNWQEGANAWDDDTVPNNFGTHITGLSPNPNIDADVVDDQTNGLDWQPSGNPSMFKLNESAQSWEPVLNTEIPTLNAGDVFELLIRGARKDNDVLFNITDNTSVPTDTKLRSTGSIARGDVSFTPDIGLNQFAVIGNPFHAIVDMNEVLSSNAGYRNFIYVYDPNIGGSADGNQTSTELGGRGGYVTVDVTNGNTSLDTSLDITITDANQFLQPYQAVFVQASSSTSPGTITFQESNKQVNQTQIDVFREAPKSRLYVNIFDANSFQKQDTPDDGMVVYFSAEGNNAIDNNDAVKLMNPDETLARKHNKTLLSFENRAMPKEGEVLELFVDKYITSDYLLEIGVDGLVDTEVILYDKYLKGEVLIKNNDSQMYAYRVEVGNAESKATDRFEIRFKATTLGNAYFDEAKITMYPNPVEDKLNLNLSQYSGEVKQLRIFDVTGKLVNSLGVDKQTHLEISMGSYPSGLYIVKIETENEQLQHKIIKN